MAMKKQIRVKRRERNVIENKNWFWRPQGA